MAQLHLTRIRRHAGIALAFATLLGACGRDSGDAGGNGASLLTNAPADAQLALAVPVDYRLTEERFARWEVAQRNLDRLPASSFPKTGARGGDVIENAVARLESNARARRAVESAGLSVRDFVLQTLALAQAAGAAESGRATVTIPPENIVFVADHRARILRAQARSEARSKSYVEESVEMSAGSPSGEEADARAAAEQRPRDDGSIEISKDPPALPPIPRELPRNQIPATPPVLPPIPSAPPTSNPIPTTPPVRDSIRGLR
ncbi:MAG: hypothetical protein H0T21_04245 [Gemmatimonadaceae bacterium]|nr:hypothetical protein [Gemmatimonadaceae bacterium]